MSKIGDEQFSDILQAISVSADGLRKICADLGCDPKDFYRYLNQADAEAKQRYAHAKELQADVIFDDMMDIADESSNDTYEDENGNIKTNNEIVQRSKLRVETRKWILAKARPKKYGDKIEHDTTIRVESTENIDAVIERMGGAKAAREILGGAIGNNC